MTSIVYPNAVAPAAERRTLTMAFVAALHLVVIYAILVALNIAPSPISDKGIQWIPSQPPIEHPPTQTPPVKLIQPGTVVAVPPIIDINNPPPDGGGDTIHGPTGTGTGITPDVFRMASAVAGTHTIPDYPAFDRRLNHEGTVSLNIAVDANGEITGATVTQSSGYDGLDSAAIAWVKAHWRYTPATKNGVAVPSTVRASVVFHLTTGRG
jgi:periplasmic protein TonB